MTEKRRIAYELYAEVKMLRKKHRKIRDEFYKVRDREVKALEKVIAKEVEWKKADDECITEGLEQQIKAGIGI